VGFSAARLRTEAREAELNQALVDLSREDFLAGNFDLKSLFSLLFDRFYSEDVGSGSIQRRRAEEAPRSSAWGSARTLQHAVRDGFGFYRVFHATARVQDAEGNFITEWENGSRWVICDADARSLAHGSGMEESLGHRRTYSRVYHRRSHESLDDAYVGARAGGATDLRGIDFRSSIRSVRQK